MGCIERVWDNGDTTDCGMFPTIGDTNLCMEHLAYHVDSLRITIAAKESSLRKERAEFNRLLECLTVHRGRTVCP